MASAIQGASGTDMVITGMNCANCARHVTDALQLVPGVARAEVSLNEGRARVRWQSDATPNLPALSEAVRAAGYDAKPATNESKTQPNGWRVNVAVGLACTIPIAAGEWIFRLGMDI